MNAWSWYWLWWALVALVGGFLGPEVYALVSGAPRKHAVRAGVAAGARHRANRPASAGARTHGVRGSVHAPQPGRVPAHRPVRAVIGIWA